MAGAGGDSIPESDRKTIELIREITGKQHADDDIYALLKDCNMDPDETAQKLMFLDTFHEVKRKRDKRKESIQTRSKDSGPAAGAQRGGARSGLGNYSSYNVPAGRHDVAGRRNANGRRENGISENIERGPVPPSSQLSGIAKLPTVTPNGHKSLLNGTTSQSHIVVGSSEKVGSASPQHDAIVKSPASSAPTSTFSSVVRMDPRKSASELNYPQAPASPASVSGLMSASDPVLVPSFEPLQPGAVGTIKPEVGARHVPGEGESELNIADVGSVSDNHVHQKTSQKMETVELKPALKESQSLDSLTIALNSANIDKSHSSQELSGPSKASAAETSLQASSESNVSNSHHVTFPRNFQVPEALRNGLTFGSFKVGFGDGLMRVTESLCVDSKSGSPESPQEYKEAPKGTSRPSSSNGLGGERPDQALSPQQRPEEISPPEDIVPSGVIQDYDPANQEDLIPSEGPQHSAFNGAPNDSFGLIPSMIESQLVQLDDVKNQLQDLAATPISMGANPFQAVSNETPNLIQPGVMQSSLPMSPSPHLPLFRQPYPQNYFPYGHYIPMVMQPMQQFLSPNGFPQHISPGNLYIQSQSAAAGIKFPVPQFKPGANVANPTPFGIPSAYGSYSPSPIGYSLGPTVTSGSSAGNDDLAASQLKENLGYTTQLNEGLAAWIPQVGQGMAGSAVNSSYSMLPQSQHVTYSPSQPVHGPYAGILQPPQAMNAPSVHTLLQQSQAMASSVESVHPQPGIYQQQAQPAQWNANC